MKENRQNSDKLTIRCSHEKAERIRKLCETSGQTLCSLLVDSIIKKPFIVSNSYDLCMLSNLCVNIENSLQCNEDKEIFKKGMENIWEALLTI